MPSTAGRSIAAVQARVEKLERAVLRDPLEAVSLPLIRKDIEVQAATLKAEIEGLRESLRSAYDFNKWLLGLMIGNSVAILGLAFQSFRTSQKSE